MLLSFYAMGKQRLYFLLFLGLLLFCNCYSIEKKIHQGIIRNCPVNNYWSNFNFSDPSWTQKPKNLERIIIRYIQGLDHCDSKSANESLKSTIIRVEKEGTENIYKLFLELFRKYLYDPNSPFRNDEYYIPIVEHVIQDGTSSSTDKERARFNLAVLQKNCIGRKANDFTYNLSSGKTGSLSQIKSDYTLLMFYNPDCHACEETIQNIKKSYPINSLLKEGKIKILAVYPDSNLEIWKKHFKDIPSEWINSYDLQQRIEKNRLYDLKAIPTLYLLDKEKKVILKDADFPALEKWISQNIVNKSD